jgi:hypothetical protein
LQRLGDAHVQLEVSGWDIRIGYDSNLAGTVFIRVEPAVGDNYPSVLRDMKTTRVKQMKTPSNSWWAEAKSASFVSVTNKFCAKHTSEKDIRWVFDQPYVDIDFKVVTVAELQEPLPPPFIKQKPKLQPPYLQLVKPNA